MNMNQKDLQTQIDFYTSTAAMAAMRTLDLEREIKVASDSFLKATGAVLALRKILEIQVEDERLAALKVNEQKT